MPFDGTTTTTTPVQDALLKAADLIRTHGHEKQRFIGPMGQLCTIQAIMMGATGISASLADWKPQDPVFITARNRFEQKTGIPPAPWSMHPICAWNNAPERTADQVIAALEHAARETSDAV